jgi:tetratricopeptide (TPR) repeat protein
MLPNLSPASARRLGEWGFALGLGIALAVAYHNTWRSPFLFDDLPSTLGNASLRSLASAWHPPEDTTVSGRPVLNLSLALNYAAGRYDMLGYHLVNLLILWAGALFLFGAVRRVAERMSGLTANSAALFAGSAALLWALHPLQTESVTYVVQRAESLMGLAYLGVLYCTVRAAEAERMARAGRAWCLGAVLLCWLGMGTKEVMVSAPVIAFALDRTSLAGSWAGAWRQRRAMYLGMFASWFLLAVLVKSTHGRSGTVGFGVELSPWRFYRTQAWGLWHYLRLAVWPAGQIFDYGTYWIDSPRHWLPASVAALGLAVATAAAFWRRHWAGWLGLWFFAVLAPTSIVFGTRQTLAEHRMYLALAPVLLFLLGAIWRYAGRWTVMGAVGLAVALGVATEQRNRVYQSDLTIWQDTVAKVPGSAYAWNSLGFAKFQRDRPAEAAADYQVALRLMPDYPDAWNNLGAAQQEQNQLAESRASLEKALQLLPQYPAAHGNYAKLLLLLGQPQAAYAECEESLRLQPDSPDVYATLGNALIGLGRLPEAEAAFRHAVALAPRYALALNGLGTTLLQEGHAAEGLRELNASLDADPRSGMAQANQAQALAALGRLGEADKAYQAAEALSPSVAGIRYNHGLILDRLGNYAAAAASYAEAVHLDPQLGPAYCGWAGSLYREGRPETAAQVLEQAAEMLPNSPEVHANYGAILLRLRRPREALMEFGRVQQLAPDTAGLAENLAAARRALSP